MVLIYNCTPDTQYLLVNGVLASPTIEIGSMLSATYNGPKKQ